MKNVVVNPHVCPRMGEKFCPYHAMQEKHKKLNKMQKKKKILLGSSDFKEMIETNAYYVDKSLFIEEIIENGDKIILLPRPRRFGKTLNLSMLRYFFDIRQPENKSLFADLQIWQCDDEIKSMQGKYPVIYLSLKNAKGNSWKQCYGQIQTEIANLLDEHCYLLENKNFRKEKIKIYRKILDKTADEVEYQNSLKFLCDLMYSHYNQRVVILLDEYDAPIQSAYGNNYYDEAISFVRNLMSGAYKDNSNLYKGVVTGILRVSKESIFSGLNNVGVFNILHEEFADKFGFTEDEVKAMIAYKGYDASIYDEVRKWYDGYTFGDTENIYNPWSVLTLLKRKKIKFEPYWTNTSSNDLLKQEIRNKQNSYIREDIFKLMKGETIEKNIEENFVFEDLSTRKSLVWTLLVYSGYLTTVKNIQRKKYALRIPNEEVKTIFQDTIEEWLEIDVKIRRELEEAIYGLLNNDLYKFEENLRELMIGVFSYHDTTKDKEYVYHSYLLGLFAFIGNDYIIKSNRESGTGRYDVMLMPRDKTKNGVVIETKRIEARKPKESDDDFKDRINGEIENAKNQIYEKQYCQDLIDFGIKEENIVKVPIVFAGREPYVNEL